MPRTQQKQVNKVPAVPPRFTPPQIYNPPSQPGFGQIVKEGIGFGIGQSIAHRAVSAILGPPTTTVIQNSSEKKDYCVSEKNTFDLCMKTTIQEDRCNNEHLAYTQCLELSHKVQ